MAASLAEAEPEKRKLLAVGGKGFGVAPPTVSLAQVGCGR